MPLFKVGDKVLIRNENAKKLDLLWLGPHTILEIHPKRSYVIAEITKNKQTKVHVNRLKMYQFKIQS
jgi:hypothetical protein